MLTIHYFASVREALGKANEQLEFPDDIVNVEGLMKYLGAANPDFQSLIEQSGYKLVVKKPKYSEPVIQQYGISPTYYYLFKFITSC